MSDRRVIIDYTNWRGVRALRTIIPYAIDYRPLGTPHHKEAGWYLEAMDWDKQEVRDFAMKDIRSWQPYADPAIEAKAREELGLNRCPRCLGPIHLPSPLCSEPILHGE